jgi:hypothetical protein
MKACQVLAVPGELAFSLRNSPGRDRLLNEPSPILEAWPKSPPELFA